MISFVLVLATLATSAPASEGDARIDAVREYLQPLVNNGIFNLVEETKDSAVRFRFAEGNRHSKADVVVGISVEIIVPREPSKRQAAFIVKAVKHGLYIDRRDRAAKKRWEERIRAHLAPKKEG